jgi:hypothetical protein
VRIAHALVDEFGDKELEAMLGAGGSAESTANSRI